MDVSPDERDRRLAAVREQIAAAGLDWFLVPRADEHQHTYLPACSERLPFVAGFTGSAGVAIIGASAAVIFVDGRYTIQVREQVSAGWEHRHLVEAPPERWLEERVEAGQVVGYDPRLHTPNQVKALRTAVEKKGGQMRPVARNPVEAVWTDRPPRPSTPAEAYPDELAGESSASKLGRVREALRKDGLDALVISCPDAAMWLFNIRGQDMPHNPLVLSFALVTADRAVLFASLAQVAHLREHIAADLAEVDALEGALAALGGQKVRVDQATGSAWIADTLEAAGAKVDLGPDPCLLMRACKNAQELAGIRAAHVRDGVAMARFIKWFVDTAPGELDEWAVAEKVDGLRAEGERFRDLSFTTISGFGPNGAIVHYSVTRESSAKLQDDAIFLLDSGAQYLDGTTDVTRTFVIGTPTDEMRRRYTQVLKGHVALTNARFPQGTSGSQLDILARQFLWAEGVDFDHGTGHGVGSYLCVHEGPHGISKRPNAIGFRPGMIVSNEPGYYKAGAYGIRIENLLVAVVADPQPPGAEHTVLTFEPLTVIPYDRRLIEVSLLTDAERRWIDAYHARVRATVGPLVPAEVATWLDGATAPL